MIYEQYCRRVPLFIPNVRELAKTLREMKFNWKDSINKQYGTMFTAGTTMLFLVARDSYQNLDYARSQYRFKLLALAFFLMMMGRAMARFMKKKTKVLHTG
jgi:hypothetical protein